MIKFFKNLFGKRELADRIRVSHERGYDLYFVPGIPVTRRTVGSFPPDVAKRKLIEDIKQYESSRNS